MLQDRGKRRERGGRFLIRTHTCSPFPPSFLPSEIWIFMWPYQGEGLDDKPNGFPTKKSSHATYGNFSKEFNVWNNIFSFEIFFKIYYMSNPCPIAGPIFQGSQAVPIMPQSYILAQKEGEGGGGGRIYGHSSSSSSFPFSCSKLHKVQPKKMSLLFWTKVFMGSKVDLIS